jgi:hypothetical protein
MGTTTLTKRLSAKFYSIRTQTVQVTKLEPNPNPNLLPSARINLTCCYRLLKQWRMVRINLQKREVVELHPTAVMMKTHTQTM